MPHTPQTRKPKDPDQMTGPELRLWLDDPELFRELEAAKRLRPGPSVPSVRR